MKNHYYFLLIAIIWGCGEPQPFEKDFPVLETLSPVNIDLTGATFRAKVHSKGKIPSLEYGFIWSTQDPQFENSNFVIIGEEIEEGEFEARIEHSLNPDFDYQIKAFAKLPDQYIYGNKEPLESKGSTHNPWKIAAQSAPQFDNGEYPVGVADQENGYIFDREGNYWVFKPQNGFTHFDDQPFKANGLFPNHAYAHIDTDLYLLGSGRSYLFKRNIGVWDTLTLPPFSTTLFSKFHLMFPYQDQLFILSSPQNFVYDLANSTWEEKQNFPSTAERMIGGCYLNDKAYIITAEKNVWEYDPASDSWNIISTYPGTIRIGIVSFAYQNKLYFGLSNGNNGRKTVPGLENEMWSYNLERAEWALHSRPISYMDAAATYYFFVQEKLYVGHRDTLWSYDPADDIVNKILK